MYYLFTVRRPRSILRGPMDRDWQAPVRVSLEYHNLPHGCLCAPGSRILGRHGLHPGLLRPVEGEPVHAVRGENL